ncbi:MAG: hypothetical protein IJ086_04855 [Clostridium sp.]|nr:hypothetical protein [Clostridium sp.]
MTEQEMRELISNQKEELEQSKLTIEALNTKINTDKSLIDDLNKQVTDLKVKNHDLFLKVVQEPIQNNEQFKEKAGVNVQSLSDLTNILIGGQ